MTSGGELTIYFTEPMAFPDDLLSVLNADMDKYFLFQYARDKRDPPTLPPRDKLPTNKIIEDQDGDLIISEVQDEPVEDEQVEDSTKQLL